MTGRQLAEAARVLGVTPATLDVIVYRAMQAIRKALSAAPKETSDG